MQDGLDVVLENVEEPVSLSGEGAGRQDVKRVDRHAEVRRCGDAAGEERDRLGQEFRRIVERCFGQRRRRRTIRRRRPVVASVALAGEASSRGAPGRGAGRFGGMSAWLLPLLGWLPPRAGRVAVAMSGLVMVGAVMAALTLTASPAGGGRAAQSDVASSIRRDVHPFRAAACCAAGFRGPAASVQGGGGTVPGELRSVRVRSRRCLGTAGSAPRSANSMNSRDLPETMNAGGGTRTPDTRIMIPLL
jgi:hypothetical protein